MGRKSLDNILSEEQDTTAEIRQQSPDEVAEKVEEPKAEEPEAKEPEKPVPESEPTSQQMVPLAAKQDEVRKRQAVETERDQFRTQLEQLRHEIEAKKEPEEPKDIFDDTQGWQQQFGGQVVSAAVQQATYQAKLQQSEFYARKNIEGFDDSWTDLNKWLQENPAIAQQATADIDPWGFAYRQFNNQRQLAEVGDVDALKAKIREEVLAEVQAQSVEQAAPAIPPSLSTQRSVSSRSGPAWAGPKPLGELLG